MWLFIYFLICSVPYLFSFDKCQPLKWSSYLHSHQWELTQVVNYIQEWLQFPFCFGLQHISLCLNISWIWTHPMPQNYSAINGMHVPIKEHFSLFSFRFACLHLCNNCFNLLSWSLTSATNSVIKKIISNAKDTRLVIEQFVYFLFEHIVSWCCSLQSLVYQYLPNGQENVFRYDDFSSSSRLWYP